MVLFQETKDGAYAINLGDNESKGAHCILLSIGRSAAA